MIRSLTDGRWRWPAAVAGLFAVTFAFLSAETLRVKAYAWMIDELVYTKSAQAFASDPLHARAFSEPYAVPNALYARILALPYGLLSNLHAFSAGHVINALLFASTCVPVYLLARRLGAARPYSLVAAALSVWVPWAVATLVLMSESLAYPAFAWTVLIVVVAIADPRPRNDALMAIALLALVYSRTQFVVVLPAFAIGLFAHELTWPERAPGELTRRLRQHWLLGVFAGLALLVWLVLKPAVLGNYAETTHLGRFPVGLLDAMGDHLTHVVLGIGVVPALLWFVAIVRGGSSPLRREEHVFAYVSGLAALLLVYQAGFYSRQVAGGRLQERYMFYVVVLFAAGAAIALSDRRRLPALGSLFAAAAVAVPVVGAALYPPHVLGVGVLESAQSAFNDDLLSFAGRLAGSWTVNGMMAAVVAVLALVVVAAIYPHPWRRVTVPALAATCVAFCVVETAILFGRVVPQLHAQTASQFGALPKSWVDGLVPGGEKVGAIEGALAGDASAVWKWTEFWNSRIQRVYAVGGRAPVSAMPGTPMTVDAASGRIHTPHELPLLVVSANDPALRVRGEPVRTIVTGQQLLRPERPYRAEYVYGSGGGSAVGAAATELSVYPPRPGATTARVKLSLTAAEPDGQKRGTVAWAVTSESSRLRGEARLGQAVNVSIRVKVAPGATRGVVEVSAQGSGPEPSMAVSAVSVDWSS